jgi:type VI secretion system protein VasD
MCSAIKPILFAAFLVVLNACSSAPKPPPPTMVNAALEAGATVNPDARNRPSPIVVRVYELKTRAAFESADFFSLFDKDQSTLGADMLTRDEFTLRPGDTQAINRELKPETRFIAVFAGFREVERSTWRSVVPVSTGQKNAVRISLDARNLAVSASIVK